MSTKNWDNWDEKKAATKAVLRHIVNKPADGVNAVVSDAFARELYENASIGDINVPPNVKVVFMASGESALEKKGSVVIEVPPQTAANLSDDELMKKYVLGIYKMWNPGE
jgi:hypothetical protein